MTDIPEFKHKTTKLDPDKNHPHLFLLVINPLSVCIGITDTKNQVCAYSQIVNGKQLIAARIIEPSSLPFLKFLMDNEPVHTDIECIESFQFVPFRQQILENPLYQIKTAFPTYEFTPLNKVVADSDKTVFVKRGMLEKVQQLFDMVTSEDIVIPTDFLYSDTDIQ